MFKNKNILIVVIVSLLAGLCFSASKPQPSTPQTYGSVFVDKVLAVEDNFILRCNIKQWPPIIGRNISVRINAVESPSAVIDKEQDEKLKEETKKFIQTTLKNSKTMTLKNIKRGNTFCIIADVILDSNSLADLLINNNLASRTEKIDTPLILHPARILSDTDQDTSDQDLDQPQSQALYLASKNSKVFHYHTCRSVKTISPENTIEFDNIDQALETGRRPCKICKP